MKGRIKQSKWDIQLSNEKNVMDIYLLLKVFEEIWVINMAKSVLTAKRSVTDASKTNWKRATQKTAEVTCELKENKIANQTTRINSDKHKYLKSTAETPIK